MTEHYRFRTGSGRIMVFVPGHAVQPIEGGVNALHANPVLDSPMGRSALGRALSDSWLRPSIPSILMRRAYFVDLGREPDPGRPIFSREAEDFANWDNIPFLRELIRKIGVDSRERADAAATVLPSKDKESAAQWRVRVVMDDGAAVTEQSIAVTPPGAARQTVDTDARGEVGLSGLATNDLVTVEIAPRMVARWRGAGEGFVASQHTAEFPFAAPAVFEIATGALQTVVLLRPIIPRVDTDALRFAHESCVLVPLSPRRSHLVPLAAAVAVLSRRPGVRLLAVGHTSADGDADANEQLATRRAQCASYLLDGERDAWVALATDHGTPADMQRLLLYLSEAHGWLTNPGRTDGVMDKDVDAAVASFQQQYNDIFDAAVDVDGVCGEQTLGALFDCQTYELQVHLDTLGASSADLRWFEPGATAAATSILAHPAIAGSDTADGQRRVDVLFLSDDVEFQASEGAVELLYDVARFDPLTVPPVAEALGDLVMHVIDHYGRPMTDAKYVLETTQERREGATDASGTIVERGLLGEFARLVCDGNLQALDPRYREAADLRRELPPAQDGPEDDFDEDDFDEDDLDDDDLDDDDAQE